MFERSRISCVSVVFLAYLLYLVVFTLSPFMITVDSSRSLSGLVAQKFDIHSVFWRVPLWDVFTNILLFVPFGFLFVSLPGVRTYPFSAKLFLTGTCVCLMSLSLEIAQVFLPRFPSVVDVFWNTLGGIIGILIAIWFYSPISRAVYRWWLNFQTSWMLPWFLFTYIIGLVGINSVHFHLGHEFSDWDPNFTFQIGNEGTFDRPWLGSMFLLAIYDRALSQKEVRTNWVAGTMSDSVPKRVGDGLVVYYDFTEGVGVVVHDRSSGNWPLDLEIRDMDHIKWLRPQGIELLTNTIISSSEPARKLFESNLHKRSSFALEVWISPAHLNQNGPARIVSYSSNPWERNFTLGQSNRKIVSRIRTPVSGLNGARPQLETKDDPLTTGIQHLVVTYRDGVETLYVNGLSHSTLAFDDTVNPMKAVEEYVGWKYMWLYWTVALSPLGMLAYLLISRNRSHSVSTVILSCVVGMIVLVAMEWIPTMTLGEEIDFSLILMGSGIVLLSIQTTAILNRAIQAI